MKLILSAVSLLNASRVSRQIPDSSIINSIKDVVDYNGDDVSIMQDHGCHCGILSNDAFTNVGTPFDPRDRFCRSWQAARRCVTLLQGPCNGGEDQSYTGSDFDSGCTGLSGCKKAVCDIDVAFHAAVFNETDALNTSVTCSAGSGVLTARDSCCGSSPFEYYTFNSANSTCGNTTAPSTTGLLRYTDQDFYFAEESSPGNPNVTTRSTGYTSNPLSNMYDADYSTYIKSYKSDKTSFALFMYWGNSYSSSEAIKTIMLHQSRDSHAPWTANELEVRCLKSGTYSVCQKEEYYDLAAVQARDFALPFHCNDDCVGVEVYNSLSSWAGLIWITEFHIEIECSTVDSENYCI